VSAAMAEESPGDSAHHVALNLAGAFITGVALFPTKDGMTQLLILFNSAM
jgi:hypothetical protein